MRKKDIGINLGDAVFVRPHHLTQLKFTTQNILQRASAKNPWKSPEIVVSACTEQAKLVTETHLKRIRDQGIGSSYSPDLVGFTPESAQAFQGRLTVALTEMLDPHRPVVVGGVERDKICDSCQLGHHCGLNEAERDKEDGFVGGLSRDLFINRIPYQKVPTDLGDQIHLPPGILQRVLKFRCK